MRAFCVTFLVLAGLVASGAEALELDLPVGAQQGYAAASYDGADLPVSVWSDQGIEAIRAEGEAFRQVWQIPGAAQSTAQLMATLREQLVSAGFEVAFECAAKACGGFDFRYGIEVLPAPAMHVDLGDFRVLTASRSEDAGSEHVGLLVSRSAERGFVQVISVNGAAEPAVAEPTGEEQTVRTNVEPRPSANPGFAPPPPSLSTDDIGSKLQGQGHAVLTDLSFQTGSSQLAEQEFASLAALAEFLEANPEAGIVLVGHTDSEGALSANVALSKKRATAVLNRLFEAHGIAPVRMRAEGVGYLAPVASNATEDGRQSNRRVEVILTGTE